MKFIKSAAARIPIWKCYTSTTYIRDCLKQIERILMCATARETQRTPLFASECWMHTIFCSFMLLNYFYNYAATFFFWFSFELVFTLENQWDFVLDYNASGFSRYFVLVQVLLNILYAFFNAWIEMRFFFSLIHGSVVACTSFVDDRLINLWTWKIE